MSDDAKIATLQSWLAGPMEPEARAAIERVRRAEDVLYVAVLPDVHLAGDVCVGTAMATSRLVYPSAVGGDIGCGMLALGFDASADVLSDGRIAGNILRRLKEAITVERRHRSATLPLPAGLNRNDLTHPALQSSFASSGLLQFGTLGGGNHFIELQADEDNRLWLMVHSGSRGLGQAIKQHHTARASIRSESLMALDAGSDEGKMYLSDQNWARQYAQANRAAMAEQVCEVLSDVCTISRVESLTVACDHNHVQWESHFDQQWLVHRKGAMPAEAGQVGIVPGSMGTLSYHVEGKGHAPALRSSAHGAGRQMSRRAARERFNQRDVRRQLDGVWFDPRSADALREESPGSYKDVRKVMRAQQELVKVMRTLKPLLIYKGP